MARFEGGRITADDIDALIVALPAEQRPAPGADLEAWYGDLVRRLVVDRQLLQAARVAGLDEGREFRLRRIALERQLTVQSCLAELEPGLSEVTAEETAAAYEARLDQFQAPERRSTFHLYLRRDAGESLEELEAQMQAIRERVLRGEAFQRLAQSESDSETRHRQGGIGWIVRGQLPPDLEEVVFSLEEGVPSEPVVEPDGVHLFQVDDVLPQRRLPLNEVRQNLRIQLEAEKIAAALDRVSALNATPEVSIVDRETLEALVEAGTEQGAVLTASDYTLSLQEFRQRLGRVLGSESTAAGGGIANERAWDFLERLQRHEAAYEHCAREGFLPGDAVAARIEAWQEGALVEMMRRQRMRERVAAMPDRLELYYQSNIGQFTPPVEWQLERLRINFDDPERAKAVMARLEEAAAANDADLPALQEEVGGTIEPLGWLTLEQMRGINTKLPQRVAPLGQKALVAPVRVNDRLELYRTIDRRQFEPLSFEEVREEVASAYLRQYTSDIYDELEADILRGIGFELFTERLADLRRAGLPRPEITVEQLDALLSGSQ